MSAARIQVGHIGAADAALQHELMQEQASALGRLGRALEAALAALTEFDAGHPRGGLLPAARRRREGLITDAANCLWNLAVQREVCGLNDDGRLMDDYGVPAEVRRRAGLVAASVRRRARS